MGSEERVMRRTKIVCTLGPASETREVIRGLVRAGMDVARLNFSHGTHAWHAERLGIVREVQREIGRPIAILQDLCGPKLRIGELPDGGVTLRPGESCLLSPGPHIADPVTVIPLPIPELMKALRPGHHVFLDDGMIDLRVDARTDAGLRCEIIHGGILRGRKGISAPDVPFDIPTLTAKDFDDLEAGLALGVDFVAVSFVRQAADLRPVREAILRTGSPAQIIAKIEQPEAVADMDKVTQAADGIMVARGDLGVEMPLVQVPVIQKELIRCARKHGKPVITATQMLESMTRSPRPTRAEVSDVANAIFDGTSAVMLSAESAAGDYPIETVRTMAAIADYTENNLDYERLHAEALALRTDSITEAISQGVVEIARDLKAAAIICATSSGHTARQVSRLRPRTPIIAATAIPATYQRLPLYWGVRPMLVAPSRNTDEEALTVVRSARQAGWVQPGDCVVLTLGAAVGAPGHTNLIKVHIVPTED